MKKTRAEIDEIAAGCKKLPMERATDAFNETMEGFVKPAVRKGSLVLPLGHTLVYLHAHSRAAIRQLQPGVARLLKATATVAAIAQTNRAPIAPTRLSPLHRASRPSHTEQSTRTPARGRTRDTHSAVAPQRRAARCCDRAASPRTAASSAAPRRGSRHRKHNSVSSDLMEPDTYSASGSTSLVPLKWTTLRTKPVKWPTRYACIENNIYPLQSWELVRQQGTHAAGEYNPEALFDDISASR
jgi:hypothetical protein